METTVILVSHNMDEAAQNFVDRICAIKDGRVQVVAAPAELFADRGKAESMGLDISKTHAVLKQSQRETRPRDCECKPANPRLSRRAKQQIVLAVKKAVKGNA